MSTVESNKVLAPGWRREENSPFHCWFGPTGQEGCGGRAFWRKGQFDGCCNNEVCLEKAGVFMTSPPATDVPNPPGLEALLPTPCGECGAKAGEVCDTTLNARNLGYAAKRICLSRVQANLTEAWQVRREMDELRRLKL